MREMEVVFLLDPSWILRAEARKPREAKFLKVSSETELPSKGAL